MAKDDDGIPPDEVMRKLRDFMKKNFGDGVSLMGFPAGGGFANHPEEEASPSKSGDSSPPESDVSRKVFDFDLQPKDIKAHLDRYVVRQDEAKKALAIAVCDHYNHARYLRNHRGSSAIEITKQNILILGPTGVGKTYLVKHIADLVGVPFVKADATKFSETGYVGGDVDDLIRELVRKANGDVELAEYGIVYIDEVDKLATRGQLMGRDVSGRGVQTALLKLMEETEVALRSPNDIQGQMQAMMEMSRGKGPGRQTVNTRNILFIVSGAFAGLDEIVGRRVKKAAIGFAEGPRARPDETAMLRESSTKDFIDYGFEAEFVGRLPVRVVCQPLTAPDLLEIMKFSQGSLLRQYELDFEAYGMRLRFTDEALEHIANVAAEEQTGARGLVTVCERVLRNFKYELPGTAVSELVVDAALLNEPDRILKECLAKGLGAASGRALADLASFRRVFAEQHGVRITFTDEAVILLVQQAEDRKMPVASLAQELFRDFHFGLKLIQKNTGQTDFLLPRSAIEDPEHYISDCIVESYGRSKAGTGRGLNPEADFPPEPDPTRTGPHDGGMA